METIYQEYLFHEIPGIIYPFEASIKEVWKFPIRIFGNIEGRSFEIRFFLFINGFDYGSLNPKNYKIEYLAFKIYN